MKARQKQFSDIDNETDPLAVRMTRNRPHGSTTARVVAAGCVMLQVAILFLWTHDYLTCVGLGVLAWSAAVGVRLPWQSVLRTPTAHVVLAILMIGKYSIAPTAVDPIRDYAGTSQSAMEIAIYMILVQITLIFGYIRRRIPFWFPTLTTLSLLLLSDVSTHHANERYLLLGAVILCAVGSGFIFRLSREPAPGRHATGWFPYVLSVVTVCVVGAGAAILLQRYDTMIDRFLAGTIGRVGTGSARTAFSGDGSIANVDAWKREGDDRIALRIFSNAEPGYVSGMVFSNYQGRKWKVPPTDRRPEEQSTRIYFESMVGREQSDDISRLPIPAEGRSLIEIEETRKTRPIPGAPPYQEFEIWPANHVPPVAFRPFGADVIATTERSLSIDPFGNLSPDKDDRGKPRSLFSLADRSRIPPEDDMRDAYLSLSKSPKPNVLRDAVNETLPKIFGADGYESLSNAEKCVAIESFFHTHYLYELGVEIAAERSDDLVAAFLKHAESGHCEYFASSTAILLRAVDVPTRYVTGFVVEEKNAVGDFWVARDRDAHAWVEAWDDVAERWRVVEATPSVGVPKAQGAGTGSHFGDAITTLFRRWRASLEKRNLQAELTNRAAEILSPTILLFIGCIAGVGAAFLSYQQRRNKNDGELTWFHLLLTQIHAGLKSHQLIRPAEETLASFAARVADDGPSDWAIPAARWLNDYSAVRYRRNALSDDQQTRELARLESSATNLVAMMKTPAHSRRLRSNEPMPANHLAETEDDT